MFRSLVMIIVVLGAWSAAFADTLNATTKSLKPVTSFGYLDTDKDARVSREEAKADWAVAAGFSHVDTDNNGYLDKEEFAQLSRG